LFLNINKNVIYLLFEILEKKLLDIFKLLLVTTTTYIISRKKNIKTSIFKLPKIKI